MLRGFCLSRFSCVSIFTIGIRFQSFMGALNLSTVTRSNWCSEVGFVQNGVACFEFEIMLSKPLKYGVENALKFECDFEVDFLRVVADF